MNDLNMEAMTIEDTENRTMTPKDLERVLNQFSDASAKLQAKYEILQKESEELRKSLREKDLEVKRAERLSILGEMASAIAHEVRNPLGALKLFLSILKEEVSDRPEGMKAIDEMNRSINSIDHVVSNILRFSKGDPLRTGPVNINAIVQSEISFFKKSNGERISFNISLKGNPYLIGNEEGLRQVLSNLIVNSLQALRSGGAIEIETSDEEGMICIYVRDNGPGIPEHLRENLFAPFVTTKQTGIGLGLAIVKRIVEAHGGEIKAENRTEGGAEFSIRIPRSLLVPNEGDLA